MKKAKKTGKGKIALQLRPAATAAAAAAGFAAGAAGGYILFWLPAAAVICGLAGAAAAPFITAAELGRRREKLMLLQFRDFLGSLCNSFSAGRNLTGALEDSYRELSFTYGPGASFVREVRRINDGLGNGFTA
jgi:Flp pilus assembly protein TadB